MICDRKGRWSRNGRCLRTGLYLTATILVNYFHAIIIGNHDHAGEFVFVAKSAQIRAAVSIRFSQFWRQSSSIFIRCSSAWWGESLALECHCRPDLPPVFADEHCLEQIIIIEGQGYKVLQAADGLEALRVWRTAGTPIDLLVTDMVMPNGITGVELAKMLLKESQTLKVVYISGYSSEVLENSETLTEGSNFLPKPFCFEKLLSTVERSFAAESSNHTSPALA
jgi:CheY-like chemotaxis protein